MMRIVLSLVLFPLLAQPNALEIMAKVAQNQDRAEQLRSRYVYKQVTDIRVRDSANHLVRAESTTYEVFPAPDGTQRKEVSFAGKYLDHKQLLPYSKSGEPVGQGFRNQADAQMAQNLRDELTTRKSSKDGLSPKLFPLTSREQAHYTFRLVGETVAAEIPVYRISFQPKNHDEQPEIPWAGEALVSRDDFEPVQVFTKLARNVPFLIRSALGTNFHGLGFTVTYKKLEEGVWFPATYGAEFDVRVIFVYNRKIAVSLVNTDFKRTTADTDITY